MICIVPLSNKFSSNPGPLSRRRAFRNCHNGSYLLNVVLLEGILNFAIFVWVFLMASPVRLDRMIYFQTLSVKYVLLLNWFGILRCLLSNYRHSLLTCLLVFTLQHRRWQRCKSPQGKIQIPWSFCGSPKHDFLRFWEVPGHSKPHKTHTDWWHTICSFRKWR